VSTIINETDLVWVDASISLPDDNTSVIACTFGDIDVAFISDGNWRWAESAYPIEESVVCWAHLPDPTKIVCRFRASKESGK
jgi:hypothetical protein